MSIGTVLGRVSDRPRLDAGWPLLSVATLSTASGLEVIFPQQSENYDALIFRWENLGVASNAVGQEAILQTSSDGAGFSASANAYEFSGVGEAVSASGAAVIHSFGQNIGIRTSAIGLSTATALMRSSGWAIITNRDSAMNAAVEWFTAHLSTATQMLSMHGHGRRLGTDLIRGIRIKSSGAAFTEGNGYLYGITRR
jgi:hypothetical protein